MASKPQAGLYVVKVSVNPSGSAKFARLDSITGLVKVVGAAKLSTATVRGRGCVVPGTPCVAQSAVSSKEAHGVWVVRPCCGVAPDSRDGQARRSDDDCGVP